MGSACVSSDTTVLYGLSVNAFVDDLWKSFVFIKEKKNDDNVLKLKVDFSPQA